MLMARTNPATARTIDLFPLVTSSSVLRQKHQLRICRHIRLHLQIVQNIEIGIQVVILVELLQIAYGRPGLDRLVIRISLLLTNTDTKRDHNRSLGRKDRYTTPRKAT